MATDVSAAHRDTGLGATERSDLWWVAPLTTFLVLGGFVVYATFRVFYNNYYHVDEPDSAYLLSPLYSPLIVLSWLPVWVSPAMLILWAPGGFRLTCYYYRKAYYRSFLLDPPGCAVSEPTGRSYRGETRLFLFQNLHRYFLYLALVFLVILSIDVVVACIWPNEGGGRRFGISVGTLVLAANVFFLSMYTFSCHSLRHMVGGNIDCFSCVAMGQARYRLWRGASALNKNHMLWAWSSLIVVAFADFYIWMVSSGHLTDVRIF